MFQQLAATVTFVTGISAGSQYRISIMMRAHLRLRSATPSESFRAQSLLCIFAIAIFSGHARAQLLSVPALGSQVPRQVLVARTGTQDCLTDVNHRDPCASVQIKNVRFLIAWDADSKAISYLFTEDHRFVTDSELGVGGHCNVAPKVGEPLALFSYLDWLVTPKWADTRQASSGDAVWYAALQKESARPRYATITGFVQSRYLKVGQ